MNVIRNLRNTVYKKENFKGRDRRPSFSISLNFYQTILESSPETKFMFDIKKLLLINRCAKIYSRRNSTENSTGRPVENCDRFARIMSKLILNWTKTASYPLVF